MNINFQKAKIEEFQLIKSFYWDLIDEMKDQNEQIGWKKESILLMNS